MEIGMELRSKLLQANNCSFEAEITADYGDRIHIFTMDCMADRNGNITFTVTKPESISGIQGTLGGEGGKLTFDNTSSGKHRRKYRRLWTQHDFKV